VADRDLTIAEFDPILERVAVRVDPWQSRYLASDGRLTLLNSSISSISMFARSRFFRQKKKGKLSYHLVKWETICSPKEVGVLGVINTKVMNWCLIAKWVWKLLQGQGGLWLLIFRNKYVSDG
jgi:hypothetical protein